MNQNDTAYTWALIGLLQKMSVTGAASALCMAVDDLSARIGITPKELLDVIGEMTVMVGEELGAYESQPIKVTVKEVER